jgi:hypothetical protein
MKTLFPLTIFACIAFTACEPENIPEPSPTIYFSGLTQTDVNGQLLSMDSSDWSTSEAWTIQEAGLFNTSYQNHCSPEQPLSISLYPNPNNGVFALQLSKAPTTRLAFRVVDEGFNTIISRDSVYSSTVNINMSTFGIQDTVRMYYKFIENNCEFRGHGDILIQ